MKMTERKKMKKRTFCEDNSDEDEENEDDEDY